MGFLRFSKNLKVDIYLSCAEFDSTTYESMETNLELESSSKNQNVYMVGPPW